MQDRQGAGGQWIGAALAGAVLGAALQLRQPELEPATAYAGVAFAGLLLLALGFLILRRTARTPVVLVAVAALAWSLAGARAVYESQGGLDPALEGVDLAVTGVVAAMPQRTDAGQRFRLRVESAQWQGRPVQVPGELLLGWYSASAWGDGAFELQRTAADLRPGERWRFTVRLKAPHGHLNPGGFDYELWLWEQGVRATGYVRAGPRDAPPQRLEATAAHPLERARHAVREAIFQRVTDRRLAGVLAALVVGDQAAIERADWDVFRATGVAHLMSISGLHVTMFAWAAAALVGALWRRSGRLCLRWPAPHAGAVGGVLLAAAYAAFSGGGVPAQRTVWMLTAVTLLRLSGRQWPWPWVWLLAAAVVVTIDPWALTQPGFWLSFVAVGVLFATDAGREAAPSLARRAALLLREQGVVTLALAPLSLLLFGQVSLVGLAANLVAIPWVTLLVTPLAMAGVLFAPAWDAAAWAVQLLAAALQWMAAWPWAMAFLPTPPLWAAAAGIAGGLLLAMPWPLALRGLGLPLLLPALLWQAPRPGPGAFELVAADVGQGNAVIVRTAGHTLVYDAGPRYSPESDAGHRVLVPLLRHTGERVDTLVLSHRDADHTGGAAAVLSMHPQAQLLSSLEPQHALQALRPSGRCEAGQSWTWDGVRFEVLHPEPQAYGRAPKPNAISCVLRIAVPGASVLLAGDIEAPQEAALVAAGLAPADLLLVPHHGSKTSSSPGFLDAVRPRLALVQAGYRNRFGHPAPPVVQRYRERGIELAESARCGAARWHSAEPGRIECERVAQRRYWHHRIPEPEAP